MGLFLRDITGEQLADADTGLRTISAAPSLQHPTAAGVGPSRREKTDVFQWLIARICSQKGYAAGG